MIDWVRIGNVAEGGPVDNQRGEPASLFIQLVDWDGADLKRVYDPLILLVGCLLSLFVLILALRIAYGVYWKRQRQCRERSTLYRVIKPPQNVVDGKTDKRLVAVSGGTGINKLRCAGIKGPTAIRKRERKEKHLVALRLMQCQQKLELVREQLKLAQQKQEEVLQQQLIPTQHKLELIQQQSLEKEGELTHQLLEMRIERAQRKDELEMVKRISSAKDLELDQMQIRVKACEEALYEKKESVMTYDIEVAKLQAQLVKLESASAEKDVRYKFKIKESVGELEAVKKLYQGKAFEADQLKQKLDKSQASVSKVPASTSDAAIQANYLSATEGPVMEDLASTVLEITGGKHQSIKWPGNGFRVTIPVGAVPEGTTISLAVRAFLAEGFHLPENCQLISAIYWISANQRFEEEITLHLHHCAVIRSDAQCSQFKFIAGRWNQPEFPCQLKVKEGGVFISHSHEASISIKQASILGIVGEKDLPCYYWGQGFYQHKDNQSSILDYTITRYVKPLVTWVQEKYTSEGWIKHHTQILEYEETSAENPKPYVTFEVAEPADDMDKNWKVTIIGGVSFEKSVVDQLTEEHSIHVTHIGMEWMGSSNDIRCRPFREIKLLEMRGPSNHFTIFLPKQAMGAESREAPTPTCTSAVSPQLSIATLDTLPDVPLEAPEADKNKEAPPVPPATLDALPDGPLDCDHLGIVYICLADRGLVTCWLKIGVLLKLRYCGLEVIRRNQPGEEERLIAMLNQWLTSGRANKQALVTTLQRL